MISFISVLERVHSGHMIELTALVTLPGSPAFPRFAVLAVDGGISHGLRTIRGVGSETDCGSNLTLLVGLPLALDSTGTCSLSSFARLIQAVISSLLSGASNGYCTLSGSGGLT